METSASYKKRIKAHTPPSSLIKDSFRAFVFGGAICTLGELIATLYSYLGMKTEDAYTLMTVTLIVIAALLTGLGVFDNIAKYAGAGTLVPVTGFANSVVSPAIDNRSEGLVLGVGAKIFTVAGPVILYATLSGTAFGVIYYITRLFI